MSAWTDQVRAQYNARGLTARLEPGSRPAVVVVDLIRGFTDPACPVGSDLTETVEATRRLLDATRDRSLPVFFTTIAFTEEELEDVLWVRKMPALRVLVADSDWIQLDERLGRLDDEPLLAKHAASAFYGTALDELLRHAGADSVIVCGATTSGCVRATVVDACARGWPAFVPADCVGDRARGPHDANLLDIDAKYGDVIALDEALALVGKGEAS